MKKATIFRFSKVRLLAMLCLAALAGLSAKADVTIWIKAASAPRLYLSGVDGYNTWTEAVKPPKLSTSVDGWYLYCSPNDLPSNSIMIFANDNADKQTVDITSITTGTHYFIYDGGQYYHDVTQVQGASSYAIFQNPDWWFDANAITKINNETATLTYIGNENGGPKLYLWSSNTITIDEGSDIKLQRCNPSNGEEWNTYVGTYKKGAYYWLGDDGKLNPYAELPSFPTATLVEINETNFPDANFRTWVANNASVNGDGKYVDFTKTSLDCSNQEIANLNGIAYFPNLTSLNCSNNKLTSLDLSGNTALTTVTATGNTTDVKVAKATIKYKDGTESVEAPIYYLRLDDKESKIGINNIAEVIGNGFELSKVSSWTNAEVVNGTKTSGSSAPRRTLASDQHVDAAKIEGDILLLDPDNTKVSYDYNTGNSAVGNVTLGFGWTTDNITTAVEDVNATKQVAKTLYYNINGQESVTPWSGVNIVLTICTDGTRFVEKRSCK